MAHAEIIPLAAQRDADARRTAAERACALLAPEDGAVLRDAAASLSARGADGAAYVHGCETAAILADMHMDRDSVVAGLLAALPPGSERERREFAERFGTGVAALVEGVARMSELETLGLAETGASGKAVQLEALRKMLLAMVQDVRVVIVKLAGQLEALRALVRSEDTEARRRCARLARDVFAPLANRLGLWQFKWELEDLAFRVLDPEVYPRIARLLDEKRAERERFIAEASDVLRRALAASAIRAEVSGRPKHLYSIYRKMQRKDVGFGEIHDVSALRVLVDEVKDCYAVLGLVHNLWSPIPGQFDDYIAKPKGNDYRSLHTAVLGPAGRALEVQIRTYEMHRHAELGVAAHWRYKEGGRRDAKYDDKVGWLRQILQWKDDVAGARGTAEAFSTGAFDDTVYVLTPQGRVIDLPKGATPIDFAYRVHSDLGHRCRGARVDGAIVPLGTALRNGQCVEIVAAKQGGPSRDWLNPALGFLASHRARVKVRQWFNAQNLDAALAQGRAAVAKELQRAGLTSLNLEALAHRLGLAGLDEMFAGVGRGEVGPRQLQTALREIVEPPAPSEPEVLLTKKSRAQTPGSGILIVGVDKLLTVPARCCKPAPPDAIVGFVTRGRGVTIHRRGCPNVGRMPAERMIAAEWGKHDGAAFAVDIEVEAADRTGLLRDISDVLSRERINVIAANTLSRDHSARMLFTVEVGELAQLARVLKLIGEVSGVLRATRR